MTDKIEHFKNLLYRYTLAVQDLAKAKVDGDTVSSHERREVLLHRDRLIAYVGELTQQPKSVDQLPVMLDGHWTIVSDLIMAKQYAGRGRETLTMPEINDYHLANLLTLQTLMPQEQTSLTYAARQRIRWLSAQLGRRL